MPRFTLVVNGKASKVEAPEDMPLLWVLRDRLGLAGTKYGCGSGICGACTVHLDGQAYRSCQVPISAVDGKRVTTIEGLDAPGLKQAWIAEDVSQCGYCQAGQIMSAAALLNRTPLPTDKDIDNAMSGNACRCATYTRIRAAIKQAAGLPTEDKREIADVT